MLKEEILNCTDGTNLEELIQKHSSNFNIISSHQLLRISYALALTEMQKSFLEIEPKQKQELKVSSDFSSNNGKIISEMQNDFQT